MDELIEIMAGLLAAVGWIVATGLRHATPETGAGVAGLAAAVWVWGRRLQATRAIPGSVGGLALVWAAAVYTCKEWPSAKRALRGILIAAGGLALVGWWVTATWSERFAGTVVVLIPLAIGAYLEFLRWHGAEHLPTVASIRAAIHRDRVVATTREALERTVGPGSTITARQVGADRLVMSITPPIGADLGTVAEAAETGRIGNAVNRLAGKHGAGPVGVAMAHVGADGPVQGQGVLVASMGGDPLAETFRLPDILDFGADAPLLLGMGELGEPETVDVDEEFTMLVGGQRGAGKSVFVQGLLCQLARRPHTALVLCDPKRQEFRAWEGRATTLALGAKATGEAITAVWEETVRRTDATTRRKGVVSAEWPRVVLVVDELAMIGKAAPEAKLLRQTIAIGRSVNVSAIVATQRPSAQLIDTDLRTLFDVTVAFATRDRDMTEMILGEGRTPAHEIETRGVAFARRQDRRHAARFRSWLVDDDELARTAADTRTLRVDLGPAFPPLITHHITEDF